MNSHACVSVMETSAKGSGVSATREIKEGETILGFVGKRVPRKEVKNPNAALQLDKDLFLESNGTIDERLNHSCNPNCCVDFDRLALVALRDIGHGEELTFNYNTSEYDLLDQGCSFTCLCGSANCIREVKGYRYLRLSQKEEIVPLLSPFLQRKWEEENSGTQGCEEKNVIDF